MRKKVEKVPGKSPVDQWTTWTGAVPRKWRLKGAQGLVFESSVLATAGREGDIVSGTDGVVGKTAPLVSDHNGPSGISELPSPAPARLVDLYFF